MVWTVIGIGTSLFKDFIGFFSASFNFLGGVCSCGFSSEPWAVLVLGGSVFCHYSTTNAYFAFVC